MQLCSAISQEEKGGSPCLSVSREEAVDFIFCIEECLQLHTPSPPISQNKLLAKDAMLALLLLHDNYLRLTIARVMHV